MTRLGILASHRGSNFQAIIDACEQGRIPARPVIAISNNSQSHALVRARQANLASRHISQRTHPAPGAEDAAICAALDEQQVDLVITAGYMKKLGPITLARYRHRIINVHPSLLPRHGGQGMYGMRVHEAVINSGDTESGISIHWVDEQYDTGAVIAQRTVPVAPDETPESLASRLLSVEHELLVSTLAKLAADASPGNIEAPL